MLAEVRGIDADWMPEGVVMKGAKGEGKKGKLGKHAFQRVIVQMEATHRGTLDFRQALAAWEAAEDADDDSWPGLRRGRDHGDDLDD